MITWLTDTLIGKMTMTFLISMLPVVELRLGLPYGIAIGLDYPLALTAAILGQSSARPVHHPVYQKCAALSQGAC